MIGRPRRLPQTDFKMECGTWTADAGEGSMRGNAPMDQRTPKGADFGSHGRAETARM